MAATGLLGINPYQKGVNLDFSSRPVALDIQLQQREAAKREALDKYLMDYEKSINPAGMRAIDQNIVLQKLNENKAFYLKNRDAILNPAKYGAEAQSKYLANFKGLLTDISSSKQAAKQDERVTNHYISQKNLNAPDGYAEALQLSHLPINDPRYRPLDITQYRFYETLDPMKYANKVYSKIPLSEGVPTPVPVSVEGKPGYFYTKTVSKISPEYKNAVLQEGYTNYVNDEGLRKEVNNIFNNKEEVQRLEKKYGTKIPNPQVLAGIYTWDLQPIKETTSDIKASEELKNKLILSRQRSRPSAGADVANFLQGGVTALRSGNAEFINDYFKPFKAQTKTGTSGDVIGFENIEVLPGGKVKINYSLPMTINRSGVSIVTKKPQSRIIDPENTSTLQEITALYQELLGANAKAEASAASNLPVMPKTPSKVTKTKGTSNIKWK